MKWRDISWWGIFLICTYLFISVVYSNHLKNTAEESFKKGYLNGYSDGADEALDTLSFIIKKQIGNDTIVSDVSIKVKDKDTIRYFLSSSKLLKK